ncbi:hypothetical protein Q4591_10530 [Shewanella sp. 3_MG-2023]|uniref:hypothetical protein n=1 Tax=Shewanella sp. 3_MG-2023 TaxID=3062635 RepID=UPI0026E2D60E|nr:hypothetical protein [Shewanella sp. 3_MG-2023]MDO6775794.1 hypothetical protein [Shewanella sp. 3_MG-2023]
METGNSLFKSSTQSYYENQLSQRILAEIDTDTLFAKIDAMHGLTGAGVVYIDSKFNIVELRKFEAVCQINPVKIILREPPAQMNQAAFAAHLKGSQGNIRESRLVSEVAGTVVSCGAAIIGWMVILGSATAIPLTGGTSSAITYLAIGATAASSMQCVNGAYRTVNEITEPSKNDSLDSLEWYQAASNIIDLVSIAGAGAAAAVTVKSIKLMQAQTGKSTYAMLKGLSRPEQRRLSAELLRLNVTGGSNTVLKSMLRKGAVRRYSNKHITASFRLQLTDAIGASLSFTGSALSGNIRNLAIGIYEEVGV